MADGRVAWASGLDLSKQVAERFTTLSEGLGLSASELTANLGFLRVSGLTRDLE